MHRHSILLFNSLCPYLNVVVLRSFSFRTRDVQNHGVEKKRSRVEFLKLLQKDYNFSNMAIPWFSKLQRSLHPNTLQFSKPWYFSKTTKILCIQTGPKSLMMQSILYYHYILQHGGQSWWMDSVNQRNSQVARGPLCSIKGCSVKIQ